MRPDFEHMTIAELRAYCAYVQKVGVRAYELLSKVITDIVLPDPNDNLDCIQDEAQQVIQQLEVLGLASEKKTNQKGD